jgi:hypothetical protein
MIMHSQAEPIQIDNIDFRACPPRAGTGTAPARRLLQTVDYLLPLRLLRKRHAVGESRATRAEGASVPIDQEIHSPADRRTPKQQET